MAALDCRPSGYPARNWRRADAPSDHCAPTRQSNSGALYSTSIRPTVRLCTSAHCPGIMLAFDPDYARAQPL